jgi:HAE1 family hydrophobic/amphiphilic exporter-1
MVSEQLHLSNYATINLVNELSRLPGVGNVKVFGAAEYAMQIWLDPQKLYSYGLVPDDVIKAVTQQSQVVAAGQTGMPPAPQNQDFQYTVDIQFRFHDPGQFADIIVKGQTAQGGRLIRVKDVGRIELGSQTYCSYAISMAGRGDRHLSDARCQFVAGGQGGRGENGGPCPPFPARTQI